MKKEKIETYVVILVGIIAACVCVSGLMKYIIPVLSPFLIAWFAAYAVRSPSARLAEKTRISEKFWRPTLSLGALILIFGGIGLLIWQTVDFLWRLLSEISSESELYTVLAKFSEPKLPFVDKSIPEELALKISDGIREVLSSALEKLGGVITDFAGLVPKALIYILVTVIALFYFAVDLDRINGGIKSRFPEAVSKKLSEFGKNTISIVGKYITSYLKIMLITFFIMLFGFMILGVKRAAIVAVIVAIFDLLPILGVGILLVPWSICAFALGNTGQGIGILVIFVSYTVIRELIEPKILGKSLDTHPIITLISLYTGYALFGVAGLIAFPIGAVLLSQLFNKDKSAQVNE